MSGPSFAIAVNGKIFLITANGKKGIFLFRTMELKFGARTLK